MLWYRSGIVCLVIVTLANRSEGSQKTTTAITTTVTKKTKVQQYQKHQNRKLFQSIANYVPSTLVTDHNVLDLDVYDINQALEVGNFDDAYNIYQYGSYSKPVATLTLLEPLNVTLNAKTLVEGVCTNGNKVIGFVYETYLVGSKTIRIQYQADKYHPINCYVGGNPNPQFDGCFEPFGTINVTNNNDNNTQQEQSLSLGYRYMISDDNQNERTLQKLTIDAYENMYQCENCPYVDYQKFYDYYKKGAYADNIITAALEGKTTTEFNEGEIGFTKNTISNRGRLEAIRKTLTQLVMWMNVIRQMEDAIDGCKIKCANDNDNDKCKTKEQIEHSWDQAVAFYSGSMEGRDGNGRGVLLYAHAENLCRTMNTCINGRGVDGTYSKVNAEIIQQFRLGQDLLKKRMCTNVIQEKNRIVKLMIIPNIQDTLHYAFQLSQYYNNKNTRTTIDSIDEHERKVGGGAIAAASILPYIHDCNPGDAATIYHNMKYDHSVVNGITNFDLVKMILERNYHCLGIKCDDIGGIINLETNEYYNNTFPCNDQSILKTDHTTTNVEGNTKESNKNNNNHTSSKVIGSLFVIGLFVVAFIVPNTTTNNNNIYFRRHKQSLQSDEDIIIFESELFEHELS